MSNFWNEIKTHSFLLAPMEDVTDTAFREIILHLSHPDYLQVLYTEFTNTDGLCHPIGRDKVKSRLLVSHSEQKLLKEKNVKLVAQIWGNKPEKFYEATKYIDENYSFDGIDINMGCPVKKVVKQGSCSALIKFPDLAGEIIQATKEATKLPVSVKTRTGFSQHITEDWISFLLSQDPAAIILHTRTQKMQTDFPAEWEEMGKALEVRNKLKPHIPIIGNGDIFSMDDARKIHSKYPTDGFMIGRGIFQNPWFFNPDANPTINDKLNILLKHSRLYVKTWGQQRNFQVLKRFFKIYINDFNGAAVLRAKLMETNNLEEVEKIIIDFKKSNLF
ncbi:MAG: tRNA-dihydrouridine synthase [Bacteroidetes bacterium]|nr:MAG: tRNA-dihydrouridine synthase [Bacteroidota bacterium]